MDITQKSDWLNDELACNGAIVSGHPEFSRILGFDESIVCTIRFIFRSSAPRDTLFIVTIESENNSNSDLTNIALDKLGDWRHHFTDRLICIRYQRNSFDFDLINLETGQVSRMDGGQLADYFACIDSSLLNNIGTFKQINKSINDSFQVWTRKYLTKFCTINDIDACHLKSGISIFFELKRVKDDLRNWMPYTDDHTNYTALSSIARNAKAHLRVLAYNEMRSEHIALHLISEANRSLIKGSRMLVRPADVVVSGLGEKYISKQRRQN